MEFTAALMRISCQMVNHTIASILVTVWSWINQLCLMTLLGGFSADVGDNNTCAPLAALEIPRYIYMVMFATEKIFWSL